MNKHYRALNSKVQRTFRNAAKEGNVLTPRFPRSLVRVWARDQRRNVMNFRRELRRTRTRLDGLYGTSAVPPIETFQKPQTSSLPTTSSATSVSLTHEDPPNEWMERSVTPATVAAPITILTGYAREALEEQTVRELQELAKIEKLTGYSKLRKADLIEALLEQDGPVGS